jgi:putative copper resistance protein D
VARLVDLFGYIGIILHGLVILSQSIALGGAIFLILVARPFVAELGAGLVRRIARLAAWSAAGLVAAELINVGLQAGILMATVDLPLGNVLQADFAEAGLAKVGCAALLALLLWRDAPAWALGLTGVVELAAATLTTHAAARLTDNAPLLAVEYLHQLGAAIWIGAIPSFVLTLAKLSTHTGLAQVGARFSRLSMAGVACILVSGVTMVWFYIGSWPAFYGTAYGVMVGAKIAMFAALLALGAGNFLVTEALRHDQAAPVARRLYLFRCRVTHLGAARYRSDPGSGELAGYRVARPVATYSVPGLP